MTGDLQIPEWGNLLEVILEAPSVMLGNEPGEVKHLSTRRKRNRKGFPQ